MDPFHSIMRISAAGLEAQTIRTRVISENIANVHSTADKAGGDPYARKVVTFESELDRQLGVNLVRVQSVQRSGEEFKLEHNPNHPAADGNGYVKVPNINLFLETADLKEANRTFQANLQVFKQAKEMHSQTVDLLKG